MKTNIEPIVCVALGARNAGRAAVLFSMLLLPAALISLAGCHGGSTSNTGGGILNSTGPLVTSAQYIDVDGNGVDGGDVIVVTFNTVVRTLSGALASFDFLSTLDSFGTGAAVTQTIPNSDRVEITLGAGADFVPSVSMLDIRNSVNVAITALSGDDARSGGYLTPVTDVTTLAPTLIGAMYNDDDLSGGLNVGDTILCSFDKPIVVPGGATFAANFTLPVTADSFGTTPMVSAYSSEAGNRGVLVTFDASPNLTVTGTFATAVTTAGSASGIAMAAAPTITDTLTAGASPVTALTEVDLGLQIQSYFRNGQKGSLFTGNADANSPDIGPAGFDTAAGMVHYEGVVLGSPTVDLFFVADTENHRVLIFEGLPAGNFGNATVVLGQPDFASNLPNQSSSPSAGAASDTLHTPVDVQFHAATNQLFVCDAGNNRVTVFNNVVNTVTGSLSLNDGSSASYVIGQSNLITNFSNQGATPSSRTLSSPGGIHIEGTQLAIADTGNHRVLVWSSLPAASNAAASVVLGQADFVSNSADGGLGTIDGTVLESPNDVVIDSTATVNGTVGAVVVADTGNNRVLVWHSTNPASGAMADRVLGQAGFATDAAGAGGAGLDSPRGVEIFPTSTNFTTGDTIFVCDSNNDRVQVFDFSGALVDGATAVGTIGAGGSPASNTLSAPERVSLSIGTAAFLFVADVGNHRIMEFPVTTGSVATTASAEQGQPSFATAKPNGHTMNRPQAIAFAGGQMIVCDSKNNRVLIYNTTPSSGDPTPDVILGQASLFDTSANQGLAAPTSATLSSPSGVATDGTRLVIADTGNNRVLVFNTIPAVTGTAADVVLGQATFTVSTPNTGGISSSTLDSPYGLTIFGTQLIVCDRDNHRVVIWNDVTSVVDGAASSVVLGQNDFSSRLPNHGVVTTAATLHTPLEVEVAGGILWVVDSMNHRVLGFSGTTSSSISASRVIGQPSFVSGDAGIGNSRLNTPSGVASDGMRFFISDSGSNRVVVMETVPQVLDVNFDTILGQFSSSGSQANLGFATPTESTLSAPAGCYFDGRSLYVVDSGNSRIVRFR